MKQVKVRFYYHTTAEISVVVPDDMEEKDILDLASKKMGNEDVDNQLLSNIDECMDPDIVSTEDVVLDKYGNVLHNEDLVVDMTKAQDRNFLSICMITHIYNENHIAVSPQDSSEIDYYTNAQNLVRV